MKKNGTFTELLLEMYSLFKVKRSIISKEPYNHTFFREHDKDMCQIWLNVAFL